MKLHKANWTAIIITEITIIKKQLLLSGTIPTKRR